MRERTIEVSALNIAMHRPHSPERYVKLFQDALNMHFLAGQGEVHGVILGALYGIDEGVEKNEISGEIYRFIRVDPNEPWFNISTGKQASGDDLREIKIPEYMLAHMQRIPFIFYPREHELWFISKDRKDRLSAQAAERFFSVLLAATVAEHNYPEVAVTVLPAATALDEMFAMHEIRKITFQFKRPNADDDNELELKFLDRMELQNIKTINQELIGVAPSTIEPDDETKAEARIASKNGFVTVYGRNAEGTNLQESTIDKPTKKFMKVREAIETAINVLRQLGPSTSQ